MDIEAVLSCEWDGQPLAVHAGGGVIVVTVKTAKMARALLGQVRRFGKLRSTIGRVNTTLIATSQRFELHVDDVVVAALGRGTDSPLLRLAGFPHLRIWPFRLLR